MSGEMTEVQLQLNMKRLKIINGEQVKIPDVGQWEKVKKYVDKKNLTKLSREDLETVVMKLYPLHVTIEAIEEDQSSQINDKDREVSLSTAPPTPLQCFSLHAKLTACIHSLHTVQSVIRDP